MPKLFDEVAQELAFERETVRGLLGEEGWRAAARTTLNAHYTDFDIATAMWRFAVEAGFGGGRVLEPGCGSGTFLATVPEGADAELTGVELDPTTARIAQLLHPRARIRQESFALTRFPDGWFDLTMGNVPFGDYRLFDPVYNQANHSIHNHFILKSLKFTRPGGYVVALTSRFTLDAQSDHARRDIAELADLVAARRLPEGTMRRVAGTDVVMDLVVLRRREPGASARGENWASTEEIETADGPIRVNEVFARHPDWVLGTLGRRHGQYGSEDLTVTALPGPLAPRLVASLAEAAQLAQASGLGIAPRPVAAPVASEPVEDVVVLPHHVEGSILVTRSGGFARLQADGAAVAYHPPAGARDACRSRVRGSYGHLGRPSQGRPVVGGAYL